MPQAPKPSIAFISIPMPLRGCMGSGTDNYCIDGFSLANDNSTLIHRANAASMAQESSE
jgi:hypothetical protein